MFIGVHLCKNPFLATALASPWKGDMVAMKKSDF